MFDAILKFFAQPRNENAPPDTRLSVATLLVHLASVDGVVTDEERKSIATVLEERFNLGGDDVKRLVAEATRRDAESVDFYQFTGALSRLPEEERLEIIRQMWQVVFADGRIHELEDNMIWRVAELIGISTRQRMVLRKQVRGETENDAAK